MAFRPIRCRICPERGGVLEPCGKSRFADVRQLRRDWLSSAGVTSLAMLPSRCVRFADRSLASDGWTWQPAAPMST